MYIVQLMQAPHCWQQNKKRRIASYLYESVQFKRNTATVIHSIVKEYTFPICPALLQCLSFCQLKIGLLLILRHGRNSNDVSIVCLYCNLTNHLCRMIKFYCVHRCCGHNAHLFLIELCISMLWNDQLTLITNKNSLFILIYSIECFSNFHTWMKFRFHVEGARKFGNLTFVLNLKPYTLD